MCLVNGVDTCQGAKPGPTGQRPATCLGSCAAQAKAKKAQKNKDMKRTDSVETHRQRAEQARADDGGLAY